MAASLLHVAVLVVLLFSDVQAQSSSSSSTSAVEIPVVNATNTTDICSQDEYTNDCWYPVTCQTCFSRSGCAVEVLTGHCVSSKAAVESASSDLLSALYFLGGEIKYCKATDSACFTCRRGNAPAVCLGSSNCVCVSQCEKISTRPTKCLPGGIGGLSSGSLIAAAAVMCPLIAFMIFKGSPCSSNCSVRRLLRRRREKNQRDLPGGLKLDAWRSHNERAEPVDADLELRSCFVPMDSGRIQQHQPQPGAENCEPVHVEGATDSVVSRAVAATDLPISPSASGHRTAAMEDEDHTMVELHVV